MRRFLIAGALALALAGCGGTLDDKLARAQAFVEKVRATAEKVCGFQPTAAMVSNIAADLALDDRNAADVAAVNTVAAKLCDWIKPKPDGT